MQGTATKIQTDTQQYAAFFYLDSRSHVWYSQSLSLHDQQDEHGSPLSHWDPTWNTNVHVHVHTNVTMACIYMYMYMYIVSPCTDGESMQDTWPLGKYQYLQLTFYSLLAYLVTYMYTNLVCAHSQRNIFGC